ncbi:MAG TPA: TonB-dependent receptor [Vicinamibacterales bacterium]|nr:TonB-dependent receptor [Vicinamibacterales bacterium]
MPMIRPFCVSLVLCVVAASSGSAQSAESGGTRLTITVVDPSGLVIPSADVRIFIDGPQANAAPMQSARTSDRGAALVEGLTPGRYTIEAEFPGFDRGTLRNVRVRPGDNRHVVVLPLLRVQNEITVSRDAQIVAADPRARFRLELTPAEIQLLSDDPVEMEQQLREMAGPTAILRIDSFEGGQLPPKAQIKSIHVVRDAFAAENHFAGHPFVDVVTQPGVGAIRGRVDYRVRDGALSARSPLTPTRGPEQLQAYSMTVGGSLRKNTSSFSLSVTGQSAYDTPNVFVALPGGGLRSEALNVRRPVDTILVSGLFDYALTRDQTLRVSVQRRESSNKNLGIGMQDEAERGYASQTGDTSARVLLTGPMGRRMFLNSRIQVSRGSMVSASAIEAPTYQITGARTTGGAQMSGGRYSTGFIAQSDLDYVRGIHSFRTGVSIEGGSYRTDESSNYLGTYVFDNLAAFDQGQPSSYRRRIGDPNISYANLQAGVYVQDDIRVSKQLTFSPGVRYELQTHTGGPAGVGPRFGTSWAPFKSGRTTIRASVGIFHDWMNLNTYDQALRVDGVRQREINVANPAFPVALDAGTVGATNKYLLSNDIPLVRQARLNLAVDQALSQALRVTASYATQRGARLLRGNNLNAPGNGVRPDPQFVNIVEAVSDAQMRQHIFNAGATWSPGAGVVSSRRVDWRRSSLNVNYSSGAVENNTDGPFNPPASGSPEGEWAAIPHEIRRYRLNVGVTTSAMRNVTAGLTFNAMSGVPFTILTGRDDNGDLIYNDRPLGTGRNTAFTPNFRTLNGTFAYSVGLGADRRTAVERQVAPGRGGLTGGADTSRYRLTISVSANNVLNHANYGSYSGVMTSPFFLRPMTVINPRKIDINIGITF